MEPASAEFPPRSITSAWLLYCQARSNLGYFLYARSVTELMNAAWRLASTPGAFSPQPTRNNVARRKFHIPDESSGRIVGRLAGASRRMPAPCDAKRTLKNCARRAPSIICSDRAACFCLLIVATTKTAAGRRPRLASQTTHIVRSSSSPQATSNKAACARRYDDPAGPTQITLLLYAVLDARS